MTIHSTEYRGEADYQRVRDLLIESYAITGTLHNWGIDCWDWFRYNGKVFEEITSTRSWEKEVRLWETDGGKLVGTFAAYCVVWFDEANRIGMFGPVGTDRAHRRRGLGKALLGEGLRQLEALNASRVYVDSDLDRAANRLYESAGFTEFDRVYHWQKRF